MSKFKGTQGDWYLQKFTDAYTNIIRCNNGKGFETLYIASTGQDSRPQTRLDAKLMATSPLLLDKLEHCVSILNELGGRNLIPSDMVENFTNCVLNSENIIDEATSLHDR